MIKGGNVYILVVEFPQPRTKKGASGGLTLMLHANRAKGRWDKMSQRVVHKKSLQDIAAEVIPGSADALLIEETTQFIAEERCCFFIPGSAMLQFWQIFQAFTLVYIAFVYPIREGFDSRTTVGSKAFYVDVVVDLWFVADIFVNFRSAYRLEETKVLIVDQKEIAKRYLKGWFLIDFVSSLPLNYVLLLDNSSGDSGPRKSGAAFKCMRRSRRCAPLCTCIGICMRRSRSCTINPRMLRTGLKVARLLRLLRLTRRSFPRPRLLRRCFVLLVSPVGQVLCASAQASRGSKGQSALSDTSNLFCSTTRSCSAAACWAY